MAADDGADRLHVQAVPLRLGVDLLDVEGEGGLLVFQFLHPLDDLPDLVGGEAVEDDDAHRRHRRLTPAVV